MSAHRVAPGAQAKRFAAYLNRLAQAAEHADRATPLKSYCTGLLLPGERKSVEPMAARYIPTRCANPINPCTTLWPMLPGVTKTCWRRCGPGAPILYARLDGHLFPVGRVTIVLINVGSPGRIGHIRPVVLIEAYRVVKRYTRVTSIDANFSGIRFIHLRLPREPPF